MDPQFMLLILSNLFFHNSFIILPNIFSHSVLQMSGPVNTKDIIFISETDSDRDISKGVTVTRFFNRYNNTNEVRINIWQYQILGDGTSIPMKGCGTSLKEDEFQTLIKLLPSINKRVEGERAMLLMGNLENASQSELESVLAKIGHLLAKKSCDKEVVNLDVDEAEGLANCTPSSAPSTSASSCSPAIGAQTPPKKRKKQN